jgi:hypothetical protein
MRSLKRLAASARRFNGYKDITLYHNGAYSSYQMVRVNLTCFTIELYTTRIGGFCRWAY